MKGLIRLLLLLLPLVSAAQSRLPPCPADTKAYWHNCFGTFTAPNGDRYIGEWRDNKRDGQGTYTFANGNKYVGEFKDGKRNGQGTYTWPDGEKYVGEFKDGKRDGQGTYTFANGNKYVGEYKDGKFHGQGTFTTANGEKYVGEFRDGKYHGQATYTWPDGEKYVGEFRDDKRNGQGIEYRADGSISRSGQWSGDNLAQSFALDTSRFPFGGPSQAAAPATDTARAERDRLAAQPVFSSSAAQPQLPLCPASGYKHKCFGSQTFFNGTYVGEFEYGRFNGQGAFSASTGEKYVGQYRDNNRDGLGIEYRADGTVNRSGRWYGGTLTQSFVVDRSRFPFDEAEATRRRQQELDQKVLAETRERERQAAEIETERRRRQELENRLSVETQERERQAAEVEAVRRRQQELEAQLATLQSQGASRPSQQTAVVRNAHALVVGNAAYPGSMRLANPVNDATAISQKLRSLGFTVTTVTDMNRQRLVQAMTQFRRSAASADLSLLFYSGHGVQIFGTNYILPTDVDQSDVAQATIQGVRLNEVVENFMPGKTKLVFLDACRDNPLMKTGDRSVSVGLAPIAVAQGTLISYATKDGQTASDGVGARNSPFTTALLEHLADPQDIGVVLRKVREKVMQATGGKQQPWEYGSLTGGELVLSRITAR